ncbi:scavenger receptor cysteine-rich type 1 protein M130-like [Dendronephthya gigantea]|uniref:scavenger receptor cysteine-rich type 1 protein M130-like n=1 Tax=Dendronephthya gigantea TaxID=151771 RepID=UPI001068FEB2|nr:scavenger receptor cysteine-rich type 1 protein M130-like [Dendronephthya gigantea]
MGSFWCTCNVGYTGNGILCEDIDECALSAHNCLQGSNCSNTDGSYLCTCDDQHAGNGSTCQVQSGNIRLQGPLSSKGVGRIEVFRNGTWGTVCDDGWDFNDARVACRELGYLNAVRALQGKHVSSGSGQIWLNKVDCTGEEPNLNSCAHQLALGDSYCGHSRDAGVECTTTAMSVRLQGPSSFNGSGLVEVFYDGLWGPVCGDGWDRNAAEVVCRELGYAHVLNVLKRQTLHNVSTAMWLEKISCTGTEKNTTSCSHDGWTNHTCSNSKFAAVECLKDIDECSRGLGNCGVNSHCINTVGSFECICNHGYTGDGVSCEDINECIAQGVSCHSNADCFNTNGSFKCLCKERFAGDGIQKIEKCFETCFDISAILSPAEEEILHRKSASPENKFSSFPNFAYIIIGLILLLGIILLVILIRRRRRRSQRTFHDNENLQLVSKEDLHSGIGDDNKNQGSAVSKTVKESDERCELIDQDELNKVTEC